jgi:hypothetical protein
VLISAYGVASRVSGCVVRFVEHKRSGSTAVVWLRQPVVVRSQRRGAIVQEGSLVIDRSCVTLLAGCHTWAAQCRTEDVRMVRNSA